MAEEKMYPDLFREKMRAEGVSPLVIEAFVRYYCRMRQGAGSHIRESAIEPVTTGSLPQSGCLDGFRKQGERALKHVAVLKLNGGLGTSMGLDGPKCLLPVREQNSFFDIAAKQIRELNRRFGCTIPFILMNSFRTDAQTRQLLSRYPDVQTDIPSSFVQNKYPKILRDSYLPANWPQDRSLEWNPPGHGDIYTSLVSSGVLRALCNADIRYLFISNIDNCGATLDCAMLGFFAENGFPFMMEVAERTAMDRKGGHLARLKGDGRLILRELAQTAEADAAAFQDIEKYCYFNTNNLWIHLPSLDQAMQKQGAPFDLPLIVNSKRLVPQDPESPQVYQLETAMGSAISLFPDAVAVAIPRSRFLPVKKCDDLLALWSDCYVLDDRFCLRVNPRRTLPPIIVSLDQQHYGNYRMMQQRFPSGAPSLAMCRSLSVTGDVRFGRDILLRGDVSIVNRSAHQVVLPDGTVIEGAVIHR